MRPISIEEARKIDQDAVERLGMPSILLMENASRAVAEAAREMIAAHHLDEVCVLCGPGNNGGDGLAVVRHLSGETPVRYWLLAEPDPERTPDAALQLRILRNAGLEPEAAEPGPRDAALWIDALFGTGLARVPGGRAAEWIRTANASGGARLAVDIPSGLDGETGRLLDDGQGPCCFRADRTVTFEAPKHGLVVDTARDHVGEIVVGRLGLPVRDPGNEPQLS